MMIVDLYLLLFICTCILQSIYHIGAIDPDRELVYNGTIFVIFSHSTNAFDRDSGRIGCVSWGGHLATIKSLEEDTRVFSLTNATHFQCWIGLDMHPNPNFIPGPHGYIWEDGSDSMYRKFSSSADPFDSRFAKFRPNNGYSTEEGWTDADRSENSNCYLCGKIANSRGCDFVVNSTCYRTYQMATTINWYGANSSCVEWDGNLISITSAEENLLLFRRKPINAFNCWAGMYMTVNGNLVWNDGTAFNFTTWRPEYATTSPPNCVEWNTEGINGLWDNADCNTEFLKCYLCQRIQTTVLSPRLSYEVHYGNSMFGYFYASWPGVTWNTALQECIGWGGSLASIESAAEDGTLYSLAAGNDTQCWIGLEISTSGSESIIWVDGSDSSYRNYPGQIPIITSIDKYYSLRSMNGSSGGGWNALNMAETLSCFYCERLVNIRECQFTNDGFCYGTFILDNPINWFDAQSNCVMWGGNLASITSEDENTLLFLRTPYIADDCWIGLTNTNTNNGVYYWIDGEMFSYDMWASGAPNNIANTDDCARNKVTGRNEWNNYNCSSLTDIYLCKRSSNARFNPDLGELFGELINNNLGYKELEINILLYRNITLICGDVINPNSSSTNWIYSQNNDLSTNATVDSDNFNSQLGIRYISVLNSQQGFYQCRIQKQNGTMSLYTLGVFDLSVTTVTEEGRTYNYTVGIDRTDILLLCVSMNNSIDLINYRWRVGSTTTKNNLILVSSLPSSNLNYVCEVFDNDILSIILIVREPRLTVAFDRSDIQTYSQVYPTIIQFSNQRFIQNFTLSSNIEGRWKLPDGTYQAGSSVTHPYLLQQYTGLYTFYLYNWDGAEVPAFQINIAAHNFIGSNIANDATSMSDYLANGSSLFITEIITTVLCVGATDFTIVEWYTHSELNSNRTLLTTSTTGVSSYNIDISAVSTPIYLTCEVDESETYTIFVARRDSIVQVFNFDETVSYTSGSSAVLYYTNASIPDTLIHWTTESVMEGDNRIFNPEFLNPFPLSLLFSDVGAGRHTLTCFYRNSPAMVLGQTDISVRDTATVTLTYDGSQTIFSDANNPSFPSPVPINIQLPTSNVMFTCSLQECIWSIVYSNSTVRTIYSATYIIDILNSDDEGTYSLFRTTSTGNDYTTALILINVLSVPPPTTTQTMSPATSETLNESFNPIIIAVPIIIVIIALIIIIVVLVILILFYMKRLKSSSKNEKGSPSKTPLAVNSYTPTPNYVNTGLESSNIINPLYQPVSGLSNTFSNTNIDETHFIPKVHLCVEQSRVQNGNNNELQTVQGGSAPKYETIESTNIAENDMNYMVIDESALVPLEGDEATNLGDGINLGPDYVYSGLNETEYPAETAISPYYTQMQPVINKNQIATTIIPAKEFLKTYANYVKSGLAKESIFHVEFQQLNLECRRMSEISFVEALKPENKIKNTHKDVFPYDESRVVLISPSYDCNYINASWINMHQFIATMNPSKATLRDFLHMIYQTEASMVVMLTTRKEKAQIIGGVSRRVCYWPKNTDEELECENFIYKLTGSTETSAFIKNEILLNNSLENKEHAFSQFISPVWNEDSTLIDFNCVVSLLYRIIKQKQDIPSKPIIIHCEDGVSKTGILITVHNAIDEMNATKSIDIFNNVKNLRRKRMFTVPTLACYTTCYSLLNEYCSVHL